MNIVDDDGNCTYSEAISTSIDDGEYVIQVLANNTIGQSTGNPTGNTILTGQCLMAILQYI